MDSYASQKEFQSQLGIRFDLLSDWDREVARSYGAWDDGQSIATRRSFLIDREGVVQFEQSSGLNEPRDFDAMLQAVEELEGGTG